MHNTKPEPLDLHSSNLSEAWRRWSQTMNLCLDGPLSGKSDKAKCSYFLLYIGQDTRDVFNTCTLSEEEQNKPKILFEKFGDCITAQIQQSCVIDSTVSRSFHHRLKATVTGLQVRSLKR